MMNQELIKEHSIPAPDFKDLYFPTKYSQPFLTQCKVCFWKQRRSYWKHPQYNANQLFLTIVIVVIFDLVFWNKEQKLGKQQDFMNMLGAIYCVVIFLGATNASVVQHVIITERTVFYRERAAEMYSPLPYALSQVAVETIHVAIQTIVYTLILYSMIGFEWMALRFFSFYYFIFMCFVYFTLYGMMIVALTPNVQVSAIFMAFFLSFWNLFSGFLIPRTLIPIWWRWYYWASPVAWTIYGVITTQVGDKNIPIEMPGYGNVELKLYLNKSLGFDYDFLPVVALAHLGWVLLFFIVFTCGI